MKKFMKPFVTLLLVLLLAACSQTATPTGNNEKESSSKGTNSELTLEQVFEKSLKASEELQSFSVDMDLSQEITAAQEEAMKIQSSITMDVVTEPMAFYQKMNMTMGGTSESFATEAYFSKDGMFMSDPTTNTWMKFPSEMSDQLLQLSDQQTNPAEELKKLKDYVSDFSFEQDNNNYILTLQASGEDLSEFIKEAAMEGMPAELTADPAIFDAMKINDAKFVYHIDKETFYPVKTDVYMDMEISAEGESVHMIQDMKGTYNKFNEVNTITIPKEVLDTATEMDM
ncbi:hypothetical protein DOE78_19510 [Bacillus sp. Y1]|nr:DUF6612 family protein [Bacillus sp. Y1]AYA77456.1 hypothetical protein DOE78_19510 [Bacillus sp. Y1]